MRISDWSSYVFSSDLEQFITFFILGLLAIMLFMMLSFTYVGVGSTAQNFDFVRLLGESLNLKVGTWAGPAFWFTGVVVLLSTNLTVVDMIGRIVADILKTNRSEEHTSELQSLMRLSYAVFCLKQKHTTEH